VTAALRSADYRYKSVLVSRLINKLDHAGRKAQAERVMYGALEIVAEKTKENALDVFTRAIENIRPLLEVKAAASRRHLSGADRSLRDALVHARHALDARRGPRKSGKPMAERLAEEILAANKKEGIASRSARHPQNGRSQPRFRPLPLVDKQMNHKDTKTQREEGRGKAVNHSFRSLCLSVFVVHN